MARVSTYLNFNGTTEAAFLFYQRVFGGDFIGGIRRYQDVPTQFDTSLTEEEKKRVIHIELEIIGGHILMGTDVPDSMAQSVIHGNGVHLNLEVDSREDADRLFLMLSENGRINMAMQTMFWGAYYGAVTDQFGICWMINWAN